MMAGRVGDGVRRLLPGFSVRERPHGLQGRHSRAPRYQVARASPALFMIGEAGCAPRGRAFWYRQDLWRDRGHAGHGAAIRLVGEAVLLELGSAWSRYQES